MRIDPERLAYWYFRLNGFLTIENFLVHPETRRDNSTEVDVLGVRFAHRRENRTRPMVDDPVFAVPGNRHLVVIAEVKNTACRLNGPWTSPAAHNMEKVLAAIGVLPPDVWEPAADALYAVGHFEHADISLKLFCLGRFPNAELQLQFPRVPQVTFEQALTFIHSRLWKYRNEKVSHDQWDSDGKALWKSAITHRNPQDFLSHVTVDIASKPRGTRSIEELRAASDHLFYEFWMLLCAIEQLPGTVEGTPASNALLESFAVHARVLTHFFHPRSPRQDDVLAADFFPVPPAWLSSPEPEIFDSIRRRVNKEIAHLTYARQLVAAAEKAWVVELVAPPLFECMTRFLSCVSQELVGSRWADPEGLRIQSLLLSPAPAFKTIASTPGRGATKARKKDISDATD